jgi:hypothetical protein
MTGIRLDDIGRFANGIAAPFSGQNAIEIAK